MKLTILGCYSATPRTITNPTSQLLEIRNHMFLIDCGEGTQVQLRKHKIKFSRIKHIFISHLHGDHFFGLPGVISTFRLLGRESELHIYGPKGIKEAITLFLKLGDSWTNYPLFFHELESKESELIFEDDKALVKTILETEQRLCAKTKHSTAAEAATIAKKANVNKLLLGHYSTRYKSLELFMEEAKPIFDNVELAEDGKVFKI